MYNKLRILFLSRHFVIFLHFFAVYKTKGIPGEEENGGHLRGRMSKEAEKIERARDIAKDNI